MSTFLYKNQVLDLVVDSADIIRTTGRSIEKGKIDYDPLSFALKDFQTYIIGFLVLLIIYIAT